MIQPTFIIAEAGVNHNGDISLAKRLIEEAALAGADAVKFQTFKAENIVTSNAPKASYQQAKTNSDESQLQMLQKLEFSKEKWDEIIKYCRNLEILFLSTPFDLESIDDLTEQGMPIFKIPSGEITNLPYLRKVGGLNRKTIMSTGMADMKEIKEALTILEDSGTPRDKIIILHCNTQYPTPMEDVNLKAMVTIGTEFGVKIGYSDHTLGIEVAIAAVALGASVIEKHFTLDKSMPGPDHSASLEPVELQAIVKAIRNIEQALGSSVKRPSQSELPNRLLIRRSIVAAQPITIGELFTITNITVKRPGTGISPMHWDEIIGSHAIKNFKKDEVIIR